MHRIQVGNTLLYAEDGALLSHVLQKNVLSLPHPCGGTGRCGKCKLLVDGKEVLSCQYAIHGDISVILPKQEDYEPQSGILEHTPYTSHMCYALDIGTTTLALALVSLDQGRILRVLTESNPQSTFGADIMSRISHAQANGQDALRATLLTAISKMIERMGISGKQKLFVSGNPTMLHLFLGEDCRGIGVAPYTPVFLEGRRENSFLSGVSEIETLPSIHSFIGADIVAGMYLVGMPRDNKYNLLIDLGTNAEMVLYAKDKALCTAAAAGPCFEGCGISCGMSATEGAISAVRLENGRMALCTIGNKSPLGLCGTGLIDLSAFLLERGLINKSGELEDEVFPLTEDVYLESADIRQLQLAKSAVYSAILSLCRAANISFEEIDTLYLAGGFSTGINVQNAARIGLLPKALVKKAISVGNSSLLGTVKYAKEKGDLSPFTKNATYLDLAQSPEFAELFIKNMAFE